MKILEFTDVTMVYHTKEQETVALKNVSFSVEKGEFCAMVGPSGCGKSTVLSLAAGLLTPTRGSVKKGFNECGYMRQKDELFPWRNIEKNILLPLEVKKLKGEEYRRRAVALAEKYGLKGFLDSYPYQLSGGMRQRAALIRTLAPDPELLLLDEPFSALDYQTRLSVCDDVYSIIRKENKTALLITHDIAEAISVADRIIVLSARPAYVKAAHTVEFDRSLSPLKRREQPDFKDWFELLWSELNV